jgi:penicillin G amidase
LGLTEAADQLSKKLGHDSSQWQYGQEKYHHALIYHPLSLALKPEVRSQFDLGPAPRGGDGYTVNATGSSDNQTAGASFKMIVDIGDWDNSVGLNNPGQSGDPRTPHYRDLFEPWSRGKYFPIFYTRPKVESVTARSVILQQ